MQKNRIKEVSPASYTDVNIWSQVLNNLEIVKTQKNFVIKIFNYYGIMMETVLSNVCSFSSDFSHWIDIYYNDRRVNSSFFGQVKSIELVDKKEVDLYIRLYDYHHGSRLIYKLDLNRIYLRNLQILKKLEQKIYVQDEKVELGEF